MKIIKSILLKILIILIIFSIINVTNVATVDAATPFWDEIIGLGDAFLQEGEDEALKNSNVSDAETSEIMSILYNSLLTLGVIITVTIGGVLGVKFMTSSAEDKAKVKESMVPYVVGSAVIFGAFIVWKICINVFSQIQ